MKLTVTLLFLVAFVAAVATFIENDYGKETARAIIYGSNWFEVLLFLTGVNLTGSIVRYKMWKPDRLPIFTFHVSFLIILLGAGITRYFGYEGTMHIREKESSSSFLSERAYLQAELWEGDRRVLQKNWDPEFSPLSSNHFSESITLPDTGEKIQLRLEQYIGRAGEQLLPLEDGSGKAYLNFKIASGSGGPMDARDVNLAEGDAWPTDAGLLSFQEGISPPGTAPLIHFEKEGDRVYFVPQQSVSWMRMSDRATGNLSAGRRHLLETGRLYRTAGLSLVIRDILPSAVRKIVPIDNRNAPVGLVLNVNWNGKPQRAELTGTSGSPGEPVVIQSGDRQLRIRYGSISRELPFSLTLSDFVMQRYPGSSSPSTYESFVVVHDPVSKTEEPYHIYMNHILVHRGYRFYQSSYDRDEQGTILSVARDPGKLPTYAGYILMTIGFILAPFSKTGRFRKLREQLKKGKTAFVWIGFFALALPLWNTRTFAQEVTGGGFVPNPEMAHRFAALPVQDVKGRIEPIDTMAMDVMSKVSRSRSVEGVSYDRAFLGMVVDPGGWQAAPLVHVAHPGVNLLLGIEQGIKKVPFEQFFDRSVGGGSYRLLDASEKARRTPDASRSKLDKEILKVDERANVLYMTFRGDLLKLFPIPDDPGHTWVAPSEASEKLPPDVAGRVTGLWEAFVRATHSRDPEAFEKAVVDIENYQNEYGVGVIPAKKVLDAEILFNRLDIFDRLTPVYLLTGLFLLFVVFYQILKRTRVSRAIFYLTTGVLALAFAAHTAGLGLRWYVSGHAPWSNGYESLIYISWATALAGFLFARQSSFSLAATSIITGLGLFVAHLSWMDPQVTNLVPVLKSYWLTLHVSIISASYGFLALGALLGFLALILFILRNEQRPGIDDSIRELIRIDEMTLMIGLALLSVGNILGAVWANESWGRYWSWDPKETWTLISMLIYAAIIHFRLIPPLRSTFAFATGSVLSFFSVLMTYFGVNYYLTGMHSYAAGDPVPIPVFLYYTIAILALVIYLASRKRDSRLPLKKEGSGNRG